MAHIAAEALRGRMPKGACRSCGKGRQVMCRASSPLNGSEAAAEFSRRLNTRARSILYGIGD